MSYTIQTGGKRIQSNVKQSDTTGRNIITGNYVGTVSEHYDSLHTGRIGVVIPEFGTDDSVIVLLVTPFGGVTEALDSGKQPDVFGNDEEGSGGTPKSYGMWPQPPAIGTEVLVAFTASRREGFLIGSFISKDRNHMMGGRASAESFDGTIQPVGEKNPYDLTGGTIKPKDEVFADTLKTQGLEEDYSRGHSGSSARRETPSRVFGITTRGGHVFTMDDGTAEDALSRNIRIRSRGGAQILIDDTNEFVFITNHKGNAWIEIDADGRIDVYSQNDISYHSEGDFNVHAKGRINMESDIGINIRSTGSDGVKVDATTANVDVFAGNDFQIQAAVNGNVKAGGNYKETANRIDMNGPPATVASRIITKELVGNKNVLKSAATRVPEHHPWKGASTIEETFETAKGNTA